MKTLYVLWLCIAGGLTLYFGVELSKDIYKFFAYKTQATSELIDWDVICLKEDHYILKASYQYTYKKCSYRGEHLFSKPVFMSRDSAMYTIQKNEKKHWPIWIAPAHPEKSTLQRLFSIELIVKTILGIGFCLYPFWLKHFLARKGLKKGV